MEEYIYESLQGTLCSPHPQVQSLFEDGMECDRWYAEMMEAYRRLCRRLGEEDEDEDVEIIINSLRRIEREVAYQMFRYGAMFAKEKSE